MQSTKILTLGWNHGLLSVERFGARLGPLLFVLPDGRQVAPLAVAPWFSENFDSSREPLYHRLRGEWPCVPFGVARARHSVLGWPEGLAPGFLDAAHGYCSSQEWEVLEASDRCIALGIDYPACHPVARIERFIRPVVDQPAVELALAITTRSDCSLPIGLHPTLALPNGLGRWYVDLVPWELVATYPYLPIPDSVVVPGQFVPISAVPTVAGKLMDARFFPPEFAAEELLQILHTNGQLRVVNEGERFSFELSWNQKHFPSLILWISHQGLKTPPWNGRFSTLGVEPVCSAFDLGTVTARNKNPINSRGVRTVYEFHAGEAFTTSYRLAARSL